MWIPESEGEIVEAITAGGLAETATFDAKAALPKQGRSKDLAIDVAAMANVGGTLLFGVSEDEHGTPSVLNPVDLAGARERGPDRPHLHLRAAHRRDPRRPDARRSRPRVPRGGRSPFPESAAHGDRRQGPPATTGGATLAT